MCLHHGNECFSETIFPTLLTTIVCLQPVCILLWIIVLLSARFKESHFPLHYQVVPHFWKSSRHKTFLSWCLGSVPTRSPYARSGCILQVLVSRLPGQFQDVSCFEARDSPITFPCSYAGRTFWYWTFSLRL